MKISLGFLDRIVAWCFHLLSGVQLDRKAIHTEQAGITQIDSGDVSQGSTAGDL